MWLRGHHWFHVNDLSYPSLYWKHLEVIYIFCELFKLNDIQLVNVRVKASVGSKTQLDREAKYSRIDLGRSHLNHSLPSTDGLNGDMEPRVQFFPNSLYLEVFHSLGEKSLL